MARRVIGLDVGTYSVKVVHLEQRTKATGFDIHAYAEMPLSRFIEEGKEQSEQDLQTAALLHLKKLGNLDGTWIITGLPNAQAQIRSLDVPFSDPKKIEAVLPGLMDSHLPFSVENLLYTWFPVGAKPQGAHILVGFVRKEFIAQQLAHFRAADVDPRVVTLKAAALYDLVGELAPRDAAPEALYAIVDIGHKSTGICIGDKTKMRFARSVPRGGFHVTQSLAESVGMPFDEAEKRKVTAPDLSDPIREAYYAIAREIRQTILAMESESHQKVDQVFLVGGASKAAGLPEFLSTLLMTKVTLVNRFTGFGSLSTPGPEAGLALGYGILGDHMSRKVPRFNFRREEFAFSGELGSIRQRLPALATFGAILLVLLGFTGWLNNYLLGKEVSELRQKQEQSCPASAAAADKLDAKKCLEKMREEIGYKAVVPEVGATDIFLALSSEEAVPKKFDLKFKGLSIDARAKSLTFKVEASGAEIAESLVQNFNATRCFDQPVKGKSQVNPSGAVTFDMDLKYNCFKTKEK